MTDKKFLEKCAKAKVLTYEELARLNELAGESYTAQQFRLKGSGKVPVTVDQLKFLLANAQGILSGGEAVPAVAKRYRHSTFVPWRSRARNGDLFRSYD